MGKRPVPRYWKVVLIIVHRLNSLWTLPFLTLWFVHLFAWISWNFYLSNNWKPYYYLTVSQINLFFFFLFNWPQRFNQVPLGRSICNLKSLTRLWPQYIFKRLTHCPYLDSSLQESCNWKISKLNVLKLFYYNLTHSNSAWVSDARNIIK